MLTVPSAEEGLRSVPIEVRQQPRDVEKGRRNFVEVDVSCVVVAVEVVPMRCELGDE